MSILLTILQRCNAVRALDVAVIAITISAFFDFFFSIIILLLLAICTGHVCSASGGCCCQSDRRRLRCDRAPRGGRVAHTACSWEWVSAEKKITCVCVCCALCSYSSCFFFFLSFFIYRSFFSYFLRWFSFFQKYLAFFSSFFSFFIYRSFFFSFSLRCFSFFFFSLLGFLHSSLVLFFGLNFLFYFLVLCIVLHAFHTARHFNTLMLWKCGAGLRGVEAEI